MIRHVDIPVLPNAEAVSSYLVRYQTSDCSDKVIRFYRDQMVHRGWTVSSSSVTRSDTAVLCFQKTGETATIIIEQERSHRTRVMIRVVQIPVDATEGSGFILNATSH